MSMITAHSKNKVNTTTFATICIGMSEIVLAT